MAGDRGERRLRPVVELAVRVVRILVGERLGDVGENLGALAERGETFSPLRRRLRKGRQERFDVLERRLEIAPSDRSAAGRRRRPDERLLRQREAVGDSLEGARIERGSIQPLETRVFEGDEMAGEVPAVDRRDVPGLERGEPPRVVPVVQVAAILFEPLDRAEGGLESLEHLDRADPGEVARRDRREKPEPDVGRGSAVGDDRLRFLLKVVGRKVIVFGRHEGLEETKRAARREPEDALLSLRERLRLCRRRRQARLPGDPGRDDPEDEEGEQEGRPVSGEEQRGCPGEGGQAHATRHAPIETGELEIEAALRLRRRDPLEQSPSRHDQPEERAQDRVAHQPGLVGEHGDRERRAPQRNGDVTSDAAEEAPLRDSPPRWNQAGENREEAGQREAREDARRPDGRGDAWQRPARDEGQEGCRRGERAPQVVENLPPSDHGNGISRSSQGCIGNAGKKPGEELPVAPRPAVLSRSGKPVVRGKTLEELDVSDESGTREESLEEIVRQKRVVWNPTAQGLLEGVDLVDALARIDAFAEEVLVHVGDRRRVRVDPGGAGVEPLIQGPRPRQRQRRSHPRLEKRVSIDDAARFCVVKGSVQRMREGSDELARDASGQSRVGVQGQDVPDSLERRAITLVDRQEGGRPRAAKEEIELVELASLALPSDPLSFLRIPYPPALEKEKAARPVGKRPMPPVQGLDRVARRDEERLVLGRRLLQRVDPVGEQSELDLLFRVRQVMNLQPLGELADFRFARQESGNGDQREELGGNAFRELELRKTARSDELGHVAIHDRDGDFGDRDEGEHREDRELPAWRPSRRRQRQRHGE